MAFGINSISPYPKRNPIAVFAKFQRLNRADSTCFPELPICLNADAIPLAAFLMTERAFPLTDDNFPNAVDTVLVAVPTLPPAFANCARACVMRIVFSLTFGAFCIVLKNSIVSLANTLSPEAVCPVLLPALASRPID